MLTRLFSRRRPLRRKAPPAADARYSALLPDPPSQLLFIMGCHRSGTSMLYHLLAYTGQLDYLSAYDIIKYDELLHNRVTGREAEVKAGLERVLRQEKNRGLDLLAVGADLPEEYRFLMSQQAPPTTRLNVKQHLETLFFAPHLTPRSLDAFLYLCRKKRFLAGADRPLVLKNPSDYYFNFWAVHQMLPKARFIFIHRHPLSTFNSYLHGFPALLTRRSNYAALLDRNYDSLFSRLPLRRHVLLKVFQSNVMSQRLLHRLVESFQYYMAHIRRLPPESYVSVHYEELCADPAGCLSHIGERLQLDLSPRVPARFIAPRHLPLPERVKRHYADRVVDMAPYLEYCRYPAWPDNGVGTQTDE